MNPSPPKFKVPQLSLRMVKDRSVTLQKERITSAEDLAEVAGDFIGDRPVEHLIAIMVDNSGTITSITTLAQGGMNNVACRVGDVMRSVLASHASAFFLAHNHPSGDPTPSEEDFIMTESIARAAEVVGVVFLDHLVVTRHGAYASIDWRGVAEAAE